MTVQKRPEPLLDAFYKPRPVCPVCGSPSYSLDGVHPQCSMEQRDREQKARLEAAATTAAAAPAPGRPAR